MQHSTQQLPVAADATPRAVKQLIAVAVGGKSKSCLLFIQNPPTNHHHHQKNHKEADHKGERTGAGGGEKPKDKKQRTTGIRKNATREHTHTHTVRPTDCSRSRPSSTYHAMSRHVTSRHVRTPVAEDSRHGKRREETQRGPPKKTKKLWSRANQTTDSLLKNP